MKHRPLLSKELFKALVEAGIVPDSVTRVVIDIQAQQVVKLYVEEFGDERLLNIVPRLEGLEIIREDRPA